jgi:hypothetical protein
MSFASFTISFAIALSLFRSIVSLCGTTARESFVRSGLSGGVGLLCRNRSTRHCLFRVTDLRKSPAEAGLQCAQDLPLWSRKAGVSGAILPEPARLPTRPRPGL